MDSCTLSPQFASFGAIHPPKTCLYLVAVRQYRPTNSKQGLQPHHHAGILCLTHNDSFHILFPTKREFLSIKLSLAIGSTGAVRTETVRAFTEDEYRKIIAALP